MRLRSLLSRRTANAVRTFATRPRIEPPLKGLMQNTPLLVSSVLDHAAKHNGDIEIVSNSCNIKHHKVHRYNYYEASERSKKLAKALENIGAKPSDRVGTLAWNGHRHFELYYGVSGSGLVLHTVNPRLFPEQIAYIINHAEDRFLFFEAMFLPLVEGILPHLKSVEKFVMLGDKDEMPATSKLPNLICYEDLVDGTSAAGYEWPTFDEEVACSMCYTSGTTGNPKGVLYSHRSTVLHSMALCSKDSLSLSSRDVVLPVVPMFHANAWGLAYTCPMVGAKIAFPGVKLDGKSVYDFCKQEGVTFSAGVPTVWLSLLNYMDEAKVSLPDINRTVIGGSAAPPVMIQRFEKDHNCRVIHAWGMTEMSPLGTVNTLMKKHEALPYDEQLKISCMQGRVVYGVDMRIVDDQNAPLPHDGKATGRLQVRGPWIIEDYYKLDKRAVDEEKWFDTEDVSLLNSDGYMQITDRTKDIIKSGGEWISSIDLENNAMSHPHVQEAAAIAVDHPKWDQRPLLIVVKRPGSPDDLVVKQSIYDQMKKSLAKWWLPDDIVFVDSLPHTATGKVQKLELRKKFKDHKLPSH